MNESFDRRSEANSIPDELLSAYLDGEVSERERIQVEAVIAADPQSARRLASLRRTVQMVQDMPRVPVPRAFTLSEKRVGIAPAKPATAPWWSWLLRGGMVMAVLALAITLGVSYLGGQNAAAPQRTAMQPLSDAPQAAEQAPAVAVTIVTQPGVIANSASSAVQPTAAAAPLPIGGNVGGPQTPVADEVNPSVALGQTGGADGSSGLGGGGGSAPSAPVIKTPVQQPSTVKIQRSTAVAGPPAAAATSAPKAMAEPTKAPAATLAAPMTDSALPTLAPTQQASMFSASAKSPTPSSTPTSGIRIFVPSSVTPTASPTATATPTGTITMTATARALTATAAASGTPQSRVAPPAGSQEAHASQDEDVAVLKEDAAGTQANTLQRVSAPTPFPLLNGLLRFVSAHLLERAT